MRNSAYIKKGKLRLEGLFDKSNVEILNTIKTIFDLSQVNFSKAIDFEITGSNGDQFKKFFYYSGFHLIKNITDSLFDVNIQTAFIEYNSLASIIEKNKTLIVSMAYSNVGEDLNKYTHAKNIIKFLQDKNFSPSIHPDFYFRPQVPTYYLSSGFTNENVFSTDVNNLHKITTEVSDVSSIDSDFGDIKLFKIDLDYDKSEFENIMKVTLNLPKNKKEDIIEEMNKALHYLYNSIWDKRNTCLLAVPIISEASKSVDESKERVDDKTDNPKYSGQGAIYFYLTFKEDYDIGSVGFLNKIEILANVSNLLLKEIFFNYLYESGTKVGERAVQFALKSGIAAIMSRNMSHNLGSHVLSYLKYNFTSTKDLVINNVLQDIITDPKTDPNNGDKYSFCFSKKFNNINDRLSPKFDIPNKTPQLPFLLGLGRLINYLQERQDYIATISSDIIPFSSPVNFKEFVYDEFCFDKRLQRHSANQEQASNLLLEYIAKSENYSNKNITIKFSDFDGINLLNEESKKAFEKLKATEVQLPGGILGRQAFFSIMENIIRNSAKHGGNKNQSLEVIIDCKSVDGYPDLLEIFIYDNNGNGSQENIDKINKALNEPIIDSFGKIIETNKGLKEMKISCAWLRELPINIIDGNNKFGNYSSILTARSINVNNTNNLCFSFYLNKPQKVAIITERKDISHFNDNNNGWKVLTNYQYSQLKILPRLIIIDIGYDKLIKNTILELSHSRVFEYDLENLIDKNPDDSTYNLLYEEFINNNFNNRFNKFSCLSIHIDDYITEQNNTEIQKPDNVTIKSGSLIDDFNGKEIIYRTHNDTERDFLMFNNMLNQNSFSPIFTEGISGGNSTDRLIRNSKIDNLWKLKIIESSLTKILIVDERIWNHTYSGNSENITEKDNIRYLIYLNKGIFPLNIIKDLNVDHYNLYDINGKIVERIIYNNEIRLISNKNHIILDNWEHQIDFVSIHQGILDKLYDTYKIDKLKVDRFNLELKKLFNCKKYMIHSGRSKPPLFPKNVPFIQYSSLENSFFDCKFTLTELFYSAKNLIQ